MSKKKATQATKQLSLPMPTEDAFKRILRSVGSHEKDKDAAVGSLREAIKNGVDKHHLDKRAFALYRSLSRLSGNQLQTTLAHFDAYRQYGALDKRAAEQQQMFERDSELAAAKKAIAPTPKRKKNGGASAAGRKTGKFKQQLSEATAASTPTEAPEPPITLN